MNLLILQVLINIFALCIMLSPKIMAKYQMDHLQQPIKPSINSCTFFYFYFYFLSSVSHMEESTNIYPSSLFISTVWKISFGNSPLWEIRKNIQMKIKINEEGRSKWYFHKSILFTQWNIGSGSCFLDINDDTDMGMVGIVSISLTFPEVKFSQTTMISSWLIF